MKALCFVVVLILFLGVGCNTSKEDNGRNDTKNSLAKNQEGKTIKNIESHNISKNIEEIPPFDFNDLQNTKPYIDFAELYKKLIYPKISIG